MRIIKGTEPIPVEHPIVLIVGQPGICKTSLSYSAKDPLNLDFDQGAHRAVNRRDTLLINLWADVEELNEQALAPYSTVIVDTAGRCLDLLTADIALNEPKKAPGGNLSQQGWGTLKNRFRAWMTLLRSYGKDVLLLAHAKEEKDGDVKEVRADIIGGSYAEVMKVADFVGYLYMNGRDRILDFNPTDKWVGKNPGQWQPFKVPPAAKATTFFAELFDIARSTLGSISDESAEVAAKIDEWRSAIDGYTTVEQINKAVEESKKLAATMAPQVKTLVMARAKALGLVWRKDQFVARTTKSAGTAA